MIPILYHRGVKGTWLLAAGIVVLGSVGAGVWQYWRRTQAPKAPQAQAAAAPAPTGDLSLPGKVVARTVTLVGAPVEGTLEDVQVEDGQDVAEGQLLARIRNAPLAASEEEAKDELDRAQTRVSNLEAALIAARLEASRAEADALRSRSEFDRNSRVYQREQMLFREGATARNKFEKAEREYTASKAESATLGEAAQAAAARVTETARRLDEAKKTLLDKTDEMEKVKNDLLSAEVHAPVTGLIVGIRAKAGEEITRDMRDLFQIVEDVSQLNVVTPADPPVLKRLQPGMDVAVLIAELGEPVAGKVSEVRDGEFVVEFTNPDPFLKPGVTAQIQVKLP